MESITSWREEHQTTETSQKTVSYRFFCMCLTFISFWMFALGLCVGRETCPIRFDNATFSKQLSQWIESDIQEQKEYVQTVNSNEKKPEIQFFQALKTSDIDLMKNSKSARHIQKKVLVKKKKSDSLVKKVLTKESTKKKTLTSYCSSHQSVSDFSDCVTLQAAALKNATAAIELVKRLKGMGFPAYTATISIPKKGLWHRVRVGTFETIQKAKQMKTQLQRKNIDSIIVPFTRKDDFNIANAKEHMIHPES
ncbi:Sporulation/cell division region, bacteria domain protein [Candidatus Magnetomorum sp. HK-1]|nr:Sporulation/cell division region, bacteria domain protein [Candidatus Magnetomorum sp. HK-1]